MASSFSRLLLPAMIAAIIGAAPAAAIQTQFGQAVIEDFEGYAPGTLEIAFPEAEPDTFGVLSGGIVALGTPEFPATSGTMVYTGTNMVFDIADAVNYSWPGVSFRLSSGLGPVTFTVFDYDPDLDVDVVVHNIVLPSLLVASPVSFGTEDNPVFLTRFTLSSATAFAIDDLQMGLENVMPGIPEPASWLMMILGFGAVGLRLRHRQTAAGHVEPAA